MKTEHQLQKTEKFPSSLLNGDVIPISKNISLVRVAQSKPCSVPTSLKLTGETGALYSSDKRETNRRFAEPSHLAEFGARWHLPLRPPRSL